MAGDEAIPGHDEPEPAPRRLTLADLMTPEEIEDLRRRRRELNAILDKLCAEMKEDGRL